MIELSFIEDDPDCKHEVSDDWQFGGATGDDPRTDPRWMPSAYRFLDKGMMTVHHSSIPFCDHAARGPERERLNLRWPEHEIYYIFAERPDGTKAIIFNRVEEVISATEG